MDYHNPQDGQTTDQPSITQDEELFLEEEERRRASRLFLILITLLVVLAMLVTLIGPMLRAGPRRLPTPTPTPVYFQTA